MKKVYQDPFSNGTEYEIWESRNCDHCWKSSHLRKEGDNRYENQYTIMRCSIQRDIITRMCSDEPISQRTIDICQMKDCPYREEKRKRYEKDKGLPKLF